MAANCGNSLNISSKNSNSSNNVTAKSDCTLSSSHGHIASPHMTAFCFDVICAVLRNQPTPKASSYIPNDKYPLFVTWKKGRDKRLRGCIGTFSNLALPKALQEYAMISAFKDSRFDPITLSEVRDLHCAVSILVNFEKARNYQDWIIGVHGIRIEFQDNHRKRDAVYLPEVAREQGWNHVETLDNLMRKGGYRGAVTEEMRLNVSVTRFQSEKVYMSYQEYVAYKAMYGSNCAEEHSVHRCQSTSFKR